MRNTVLAVLVSVALPAAAGETPGVVVWPGADLKQYGKKLAPKVSEKKLALERLASFGNHSTLVVHRQGDGEAELHETQADFFVVLGGEATLVVGGEVVDGKTTAPGEIRGPSIKGGERKPLAAGDIVHIPAKVPHQVLVAAGKEFTHFVIKVDTP